MPALLWQKMYLVLGLLLATALTPAAHASLEAGEAAYRKGDYAAAFRAFRPLAEQGQARAQFKLGVMYRFGEGVPQDDREAAKWYRLAAEQGYAVAQFSLGFLYAKGRGVPQDYREAAKWYRLAADQGDSVAQIMLDYLYDRDQGVPREAAWWFRHLAAEQGLASAQDHLGFRYAYGLGVPQDHPEAAKWFRLAAEQGDAMAQLSLGVLYDNGQGVPQDHREAAKWYRLAAEQGNASAQNNLGAMFELGLAGLGPNLVVAYALYNLSATGDPSAANNAIRNRDRVREALSPRALDAAQALTRALARPGNFARALQEHLGTAARRGGNK